MALIRLKGVGQVEGTAAGEIKAGDTICWNFGYSSKVSSVDLSKTGKTISVSFEGESDTRKFRVTSLVALVKKEVKEEIQEEENVELVRMESEEEMVGSSRSDSNDEYMRNQIFLALKIKETFQINYDIKTKYFYNDFGKMCFVHENDYNFVVGKENCYSVKIDKFYKGSKKEDMVRILNEKLKDFIETVNFYNKIKDEVKKKPLSRDRKKKLHSTASASGTNGVKISVPALVRDDLNLYPKDIVKWTKIGNFWSVYKINK